ncbi:MAG: hypothetical protein WC006_02170 [Bacilli bacterium]|nr:hypothetical protein [Bacilli bacterium]
MKIKKSICFVIAFVFIFFLIACNNIESEVLNKESDLVKTGDILNEQDLNLSDKDNSQEDNSNDRDTDQKLEDEIPEKELDSKYEDQETAKHELEYSSTYLFSSASQSKGNELVWIVNYTEFLEYGLLSNYDEEFFEDNGLILFGTAQPSGSIKLELDSVYLDDNGLINIIIKRLIPDIGTTDMKYHYFAIGYKKPVEEVNGVDLFFLNLRIDFKTVKLIDNTKLNEAKSFYMEMKDKLVQSKMIINFDISKKYAYESFFNFCNRMIREHNLKTYFDSKFIINGLSTYISASFDLSKLEELNDLLELANDNEFNLELQMIYYISSKLEKVN